jgi:DNA modification methylase
MVLVPSEKVDRIPWGRRGFQKPLELRLFCFGAAPQQWEPIVADLQITYQTISALRPRRTNPRTHSKKQIEQIAASMREFGFTNPVLVDGQNRIIAGHGRVEAAKLIGMTEVPTVCIRNMTEAQIQAYVIADNRLAENAGWDRELLAIELQTLSELSCDIDITVTGFELPEIDVLIDDLSVSSTDQTSSDSLDTVPEAGTGPAVTRSGDIWLIGRHRLICGDALRPETYQQLMGQQRAQMVFTDPPYNVPIARHVCGLGAIQHREFAMASGEMDSEEFTDFLEAACKNLSAFSCDGAIHFICMDWRHMTELLRAGAAAYDELKNVCVWAKANGGMGSLYRSQHELVFVFKSGTAPHINNVQLGQYGRYRTNVWSYPGINGFGSDRNDLALHPTVKPVALVADAIRDCSHRNGIVLDAFAGSGTTLLAAETTGRIGYGIEIDPAYCDVILHRARDVCGLEAVLESTGQALSDVERNRAQEAKCQAESALAEEGLQ